MGSNPLYERLTHNARPPSMRVCLWLAFGLGLATLAYMSWVMLYQPYTPYSTIAVGLMVASALLLFLLPVVVGITAATITARDAQGEEYQLLRLTNLSPRSIVWGYIGAALHRLRLPLALMIGTMPVLVVGMLWMSIEIAAIFANISMSCPVGPCGPSTLNAESANSLYWGGYSGLAGVIALWGVTLLAAMLGVWLGLAWRKAAPAAVVTALVTLLAMIGLIMLFTSFISGMSPPMATLISLLLASVPYVLGCGIARLAHPQAAKEKER